MSSPKVLWKADEIHQRAHAYQQRLNPDSTFLGTGLSRLAGLQLELLARTVALSESLRTSPERHLRLREGLLALYLDSLAAHRCTMPAAEVAALLAVDLELNAQGIGIWLDRESRPR